MEEGKGKGEGSGRREGEGNEGKEIELKKMGWLGKKSSGDFIHPCVL